MYTHNIANSQHTSHARMMSAMVDIAVLQIMGLPWVAATVCIITTEIVINLQSSHCVPNFPQERLSIWLELLLWLVSQYWST